MKNQILTAALLIASALIMSSCGKTGTAQKGEKITNDGIFICYGPYNEPEVAIAVVVERGGSGANVQRIARRIMDAYINIRSYSDSSEDEMTLLR